MVDTLGKSRILASSESREPPIMPIKPRPAYMSVRDYLRAEGKTQEQLAAEVGISPAHMSNILVKSRTCSVVVLLKIARITNVPVESIAGWAANSEKSA